MIFLTLCVNVSFLEIISGSIIIVNSHNQLNIDAHRRKKNENKENKKKFSTSRPERSCNVVHMYVGHTLCPMFPEYRVREYFSHNVC